MRGGDSKKEAKQGERTGEEGAERERGERAEIAELIVKVSTRKPSQDSHKVRAK